MRISAFVLAGLLLLGSATALEGQNARIGFIDSEVILQAAPGAMQAQQAFDQDMERYRQEIQRLGQELENLIDSYQRQQSALNPEAREIREQEIRLKETQFQQRVEELEMEAAERQQELVEPILQEMTDAIESIRSEGNYAMIFDAAQRSIIAADPALDLTDEVIRRLQQNSDRDN
ncbi:MAG: OmpH family outer membrane protein [Gemmatimonadales bacterium]|nr:MAG: OmpH family outer membrane protein [Gemmatimonadales bacterium]